MPRSTTDKDSDRSMLIYTGKAGMVEVNKVKVDTGKAGMVDVNKVHFYKNARKKGADRGKPCLR